MFCIVPKFKEKFSLFEGWGRPTLGTFESLFRSLYWIEYMIQSLRLMKIAKVSFDLPLQEKVSFYRGQKVQKHSKTAKICPNLLFLILNFGHDHPPMNPILFFVICYVILVGMVLNSWVHYMARVRAKKAIR